jgi:hypothetical protein
MPYNTRAEIELEIMRLEGHEIEELRLGWRTIFGEAPPPHLPKHIMSRILIYRLQTEKFGDLSQSAIRFLSKLARRPVDEDVPPAAPVNSLSPGTILIREYKGECHKVMVMAGGFAWGGKTYSSLSKVAFAITGKRWTGTRFFGLLEKEA